MPAIIRVQQIMSISAHQELLNVSDVLLETHTATGLCPRAHP